MSDKTFERSAIILTALVVLWIALGIVFGAMDWGWVVVVGIIVEVIGIGVLLYYWGRHYMARE